MINLNQLRSEQLLGKFFIGTVKVNVDDLQLGRVKVYIEELFEGFLDEELPWFAISRPIFQGASSDIGWFAIPRVGSKVLCTFDKGNINSGIIIGELIDNTTKMSSYGTNYPEIWGFRDENNTYLKVNTQTKVLEAHHMGTTINISETGLLTINVADNTSISVNGNTNVNVTGNTAITTSGTTSVQSNGDITVSSDSSITSTAPSITLNGDVAINGPITQGAGGSGSSSSLIGPLNVTNDVTASGISLISHTHGGVQTGSGSTGAPQ